MAEGLGIAASVIALARLAYSSSKSLYQTISGIHDAPQILKADIETLYQTIHSLKQELKKQDSNAALSEAQKSNLREIEPTLKACCNTCDAFKAQLDRLTRHSKDSHTSLWDRFKLQFQEREIGACQAQLDGCKSMLAIALDLSNL
jgi:chromosome segregation ATPase